MSAVFLQRFIDDALQFLRQLWINPDRGNRGMIQNLIKNHRSGAALKGMLARSHFVDHRSQREKIGSRIEVFAAGLLGRHVRYCPQGRTRARQIGGRDFLGGRTSRGSQFGLGGYFRKPKIQDLCLTSRAHKNIGGLNIAMDNSFGVSRVERIRQLYSDIQNAIECQRSTANQAAKSLSLKQLHRDEMVPFVFLHIVDRANIGVIQLRGGARLALKSFQRDAILGKFVWQKFQRDLAPEFNVFRFVHHSHSAYAQSA